MITIEKAMVSNQFGFDVIYDGDKHTHLFGTKCNHCGEYFIDDNVDIYCSSCKTKFNIIINLK